MQARKYPEHEGLVTPYERISYAAWDKAVNQLASSLSDMGIAKGDKVVIHMPNTKELVYAYFAVQRLGALSIPINAKLSQKEIMYIVDHSDAKMLMSHELVFRQVEALELEEGITYVKTGPSHKGWESYEELLDAGSPDVIECHLTEDDEASILYTSGTTGAPKGVVFTHRSILTVAQMICIEMTMRPENRVLHMMPLSHSAPLHLFLISGTYVGATHVLVPTFTPDLLLETVAKERTTHFFGAPIAYLASASHEKLEAYDLSSMQYWVYGGAPLDQSKVEFIQKQFKTDSLYCVYGLTEAGPSGTLLFPEEHRNKSGSIGKRAALNCEIQLVDENGQPVAQVETGEIVLKGEGNMKGYYKADELTKESLKDGWLYTGDMAYQDADGYYWVVDRKKDIIISGGVNIFPQEIEKAMFTHPNVDDVAVVGVPNPDWGETVKAFVVLREPMDGDMTDHFKTHLTELVADFKIPRLYEEMEALPRNATGKLLKSHLRDQS
nr:AMP-binding protein [Lentibacillus sp. JNUCC-1]